MPVIDVGMTREEQQAAAGKIPPSEGDHLLVADGLFKEPYTSEKGNYVLPMRVRVASGEEEGRSFPLWLVVGTFSFDDFCDATGFSWSGRAFATEDLQGLTFFGTIEYEENPDDADRPFVRLARIWSAAGSSNEGAAPSGDKIPFDA